MGADGEVLGTLAIHTGTSLVTASDLQLAPAALVQVRQHTIHGDVQPPHSGCGRLSRQAACWRVGHRLRRLSKQQATELFGSITDAIGADVYQGQTFENLGG